MAHEIDSPVSEEMIERLFGKLGEHEMAGVIALRLVILEALWQLLVRREPITKASLAKEALLKQLEVVKHIDLWQHLAEKTTEEKVVQAVKELQEAGEPVTRKRLAEKTGFSIGRLARRRKLWAHAVAVVVPKSRGVIVEACERLQRQNVTITIAEVARESGMSQGCIATNKAILSTFATYEDNPRIGKYAQGRPGASASEVFRESVERLLSPDVMEKNLRELNSMYSSMRWYEALSPTAEDREWIGFRIVELKTELARRRGEVRKSVAHESVLS